MIFEMDARSICDIIELFFQIKKNEEWIDNKFFWIEKTERCE